MSDTVTVSRELLSDAADLLTKATCMLLDHDLDAINELEGVRAVVELLGQALEAEDDK